jgi:23S rRNA pseudouridine1911/1915/1917 synthase
MNKNETPIRTLSIASTEEMVGQRADKALALHEEIRTRSRAQQLIESGSVLLRQVAVKASYSVRTGDIFEVKLSCSSDEDQEILPADIPLDIVFEDADLIVINKPSGLVMHPAVGHRQDTLVNALLFHTQDLSMKFGDVRPGIVHRIDKETSGLVVVAKNDRSHEHLSQQFKARSIERLYEAISVGRCVRPQGRLCSYLARHPQDRQRYASIRDGDRKVIDDPTANLEHAKWAVTNYKVLKSNPQFTLFELKLETGRTHQIRVHLQELGYPILGDRTYGYDRKVKSIKDRSVVQFVEESRRFYLHAKVLGFVHPSTGQNMRFEQGWPAETKKLMDRLFLSK